MRYHIMRRANYEILARVLGDSKDLPDAIEKACLALRKENPWFDKARFLQAIQEAQGKDKQAEPILP